ncbi:hypothetical protein OEW28_10420 [Defluviimonas sp. WL0002]|uniref:Uncharacterized protein n=1 Tax=Albidovulum marisflavi TaxID=2984159 RepID=A0ABT2ZD20_9RHOB|nr:hypothetical protein [Defluviimonas sp. WL0002]MCV2869040.1 hypothetical protein [Defluviimonas sp. WL0002]
MRNREVGTKHVFAGSTRLVSKLVKQPKDIDGDGTPDPIANCAAEPWGWTNGNGLGLGHANGNNGQGNGWCNGNGGGNGNNPLRAAGQVRAKSCKKWSTTLPNGV